MCRPPPLHCPLAASTIAILSIGPLECEVGHRAPHAHQCAADPRCGARPQLPSDTGCALLWLVSGVDDKELPAALCQLPAPGDAARPPLAEYDNCWLWGSSSSSSSSCCCCL